MEQNVQIQSSHVQLAATLHFPINQKAEGRVPLVIICHGFVGNRIGVNRLFVKAAREFASQGFAVLRFDYEGCGESHGEYGSYEFGRFIQQTRDVIGYGASIPGVDKNQIILLGHSLGGAVAALTASVDERIKKLMMWSAVGHPFHDIVQIIGQEEYDKTKTVPYIDHEGYALTNIFLDSLKSFAPLEKCKTFQGDVFVAHGTKDEVIPSDYCALYQHAFKRGSSRSAVKELIPGADHTFSSLEGSKALYKLSLQWLLKNTYTMEKRSVEAI